MTTALLRQPGRPRDWAGATIPPKWRQPAAGGSATDPPAGDANAFVNSLDMARALATLTPAQREVLREVFFVGRTCAAAATALGMPTGTLKSRLYYALHKLRDVLDEQRSQADSALQR